MNIHIDGDFSVPGSNCKYHCSPTCHPAQIGPDWVYGCTHIAWPQNEGGDFCPIVACGGDPNKCSIDPYLLTKQEEEELKSFNQVSPADPNSRAADQHVEGLSK